MPEPTALEPIAITGIGCRLPGGATNAESFWQMLLDGVDAIREVPQERWDSRYFYDPEPGKPGRTYSKWAGLIDEVDTFDPGFFAISQREAQYIDPQQRLLLQVAWESLVDAGQQVDIVKGEDTGVFVGISTHDYNDLQHNNLGRGGASAYSATGNAASIAANRISYALNFQGPSVAVDTACSSSMVAVHMACRAIWNKECHSAVAAGVNCILNAYPFIAFSSMNMLSPDGRCKAFDASADGFVRGEGVGAVYLKPLSAALANGDSIYAVIRSTAVNQDGRTSGMTVPSRGSQQALVEEACRLAGISPHQIQYAEAHGTGTAVGDLIEGSALGTILGVGRKAGDDCLVGSVKTNIGHLEAGSGIAGLIKVALCLKHGIVPPNLHFKNPNPSLNFERLRIKVPTEITPLKRDADHRLLACINSFGFGGTNAHAVLEAAPQEASLPPAAAVHDDSDQPELLLPLSARGTETALQSVVIAFQNYLCVEDDSVSLKAICAAAARRRTHHEFRLAAVGRTRDEISAALTSYLAGEAAPGLHVGQPVKNARLVFVFSGQGPQWWAMGRELMAQEPVFRQTIQTIHDELLRLGGCSLIDELNRDEKTTRLNETHIAQTGLFALQVGLAELWKSWGVHPHAVVGHSMGEVAAAYACGALDLLEAVRVIHHRGRCMEKTPLRGKMIAAALTQAEAEAMIAPYGDRAALAAVNGPSMVSISGDADAVDEIFRALEQRALFVRYVPVNYAFHSAHMEPVREELAESLAGLNPKAGNIRLFSTVTGRQAEGTDYDAAYWWRNVRQSVLFAPAIDSAIAAGYTHFLEISPHPVLSNSMTECLTGAGLSGMVLPSLRRQKPERATMLGTLAALHVNGHAVDWSALYPDGRYLLRLPEYPWQNDHYWNEPTYSRKLRVNPQLNPLLQIALPTLHPTWEVGLNKSLLTWLKDHRVGQHLIFPGAGYVEMALAAGRELHPEQPVLIEELEIHRGCILPNGDDHPTMQIACIPAENTFVIQSTPAENPLSWTQHVTGRLRAEPERQRPAPFDLEAIRQRCLKEWTGEKLYHSAANADLRYGPQFQGLTHVWGGETEALARIEMPAAVATALDRYEVHPALLDACIHPSIAIPADDDGLYLPARMERIRCYAKPGDKVWAYVRRTQMIARKIILIDVFILNDAGEVLLEITDFLCKYTPLSSAPGSGAQADWLYQPEWHLKPLALSTAHSPADYLPDNAALAAALRQSIASHSADLGMNARYQEWEPRFLQLCRSSILSVLKHLGFRPKVGEVLTLDALVKRLKVQPAHEKRLHRLLTLLEPEGWLQPDTAASAPAWKVMAKPATVNPTKIWQEMVFHFPGFHPELILLDRCTSGLPDLLRGKCESAALISANMLEHAQAGSVFTRAYNHSIGEAVSAALAQLPEGRRVRILEIGAATGGVTASVLPRLPHAGVDYFYTDVSDRSFDQAAKKFSDYPAVQYRVLDLDLPPADQGFADEHFDLVILSNALSLTQNVQTALQHARQLLASSGLLIALEIDRPSPWHELVLGTNERWWQFADSALRSSHPLLPSAAWQQLLSAAGFTAVESVTDADNHSQTSQAILLARGPELPQPAATAEAAAEPGHWLLFADAQGLAQSLASALRARGDTCCIVTPAGEYSAPSADVVQLRAASPEDYTRLISSAGSLRGIVHLWSLDAPADAEPSTEALSSAQTLVCHSPLYLVQALNTAGITSLPGLWFVTRGAQPAGESARTLSLVQSPLHGMARVIMSEHPDLHCRSIDLDAAASSHDTDILLKELLHADDESEIAWRGEARYAQRLVHGSLDKLLQSPLSSLAEDQGFRLESAKPGSLDKLVFRAKPRRAPGPGEVEIEICAAALNFRDVMKALGIYPAEAADAMLLGDECAGRIVRVGAGVTQFKLGDEVMALAAGCFGSHVTTVEHAVLLKPAHLTMEEAATMMVTYLTASYALSHQGRMSKGERVLIHAGTGGVGQAAVRISQAVGAEIFATAGSAEKRAFLKKIGVHHVLDSRTLAFAEDIRRITQNEGIDLVLNSLAGEAIHQSLSLLRQYGRFLEIGKRDIYGNTKVGLFPFRKNLSYHAIDLGHALDPRNARPLMSSLKKLFSSRKLPALPYRTFALADAVTAFRYITQARQIGKVVLNVQGARVALSSDTPASALQLQPDATYLVVGGMGGFGMAMSEWLVKQGARHLVLSSRSGASTDEARAGIAAMQAAGAEVTVIQSDASDSASVTALLNQIAASHPPLRGVFHVAMVLDDGMISQLNAERFRKVTAPKINGAWNLHVQTRHLALDHFVMFSSVASIIGSPGQANYAAANAFLDALASHRRSLGLPALTINWGVMAGVGYVARHKKLEEHFARIGWSGITPAESLPIMGRLMQQPAISQMMVSRIDWAKWAALTPSIATTPRYAHLTTEDALKQQQSEDSNWLRDAVLNAQPAEQITLLDTFLREQVAKILRTSPAKIDSKLPLNEIGIDSLMAVELIHQIESQTGIAIPTGQLMGGTPTVQKLTEILLGHLTGGKAAPAAAAPAAESAPATAGEDFSADADLSRWDITFATDRVDASRIQQPRSIFLTGVQEFIGAYLLRDLLQQTQAEVHCLISAADAAAAMQQIESHLAHYRCWDDAFRTRIIPVLGDLSQPLLGLEPAAFAQLASTVEVIYHAAAHINHVAPYSVLRQVNVQGSVEVIRLATQSTLKPVHCLSSASALAASSALDDRPIHEDDPLPVHAKLKVGYSQSRWVSEQLFLQARARGLPVNVYRPGLFVGDDQTGICTTDNIIWLFIKTCIETGTGPDSSYSSLLTPVDYVSSALISLSKKLTGTGRNYHLINPSAPSFARLLDLAKAEGYRIHVLPEEEWENAISGGKGGIQPNPIAAYQLFIPRQVLTLLVQEQSEQFCHNTLQDLQGTGITCPPIDQPRMHRYLQYFASTGFLPPAADAAKS
ncbi:type I polyketide synthase [Prosthecobacter vanneervenii]|uniref:Thioester reductase-like protein n=1 Tax=Prosthecobacter vanneervenii TaxID=48466 RepID=A0A7W7YFH7_9BACT|nr:type I polyketide synthase [Prosthecobacter vanneervenii]MBB5035203.1 thioester reductase-like protein [Prosthecobacter vanneervenii]